jgi:hypothetical protein
MNFVVKIQFYNVWSFGDISIIIEVLILTLLSDIEIEELLKF